MKRILTFTFTLIMCLTFCVSVLAADTQAELDILDTDMNAIIIRTSADWEQMRQDDLNAYQSKLDKIDSGLRADFDSFISANPEMSPIQTGKVSANHCINDEELLAEFLQAYPEYKDMDADTLVANVETLNDNIVVSAVRKFFDSNGYTFSLDLFNHSLNDNPAMVAYTLTRHTEGMYGYLKGLLTTDPFLDEMVRFSEESNSYKRVSDSSYTFDSGDLFWSIHGFTWTRTRTQYGRASFTIDDIYDFDPHSIPGVVAGWAGTNDFDVYIAGVVENGDFL